MAQPDVPRSGSRGNSAIAEMLRAALHFSTGDLVADEAMRSAIRSGIVGDDADLVDVFEREAGPEQAEVDLHLEGATVENHATSAKSLSKFIGGISEAVKETAKHRAGKGRHTEDLLVEGVTPGSVRVVLRAPKPRVAKNQHVDDKTVASTIDSDALRSIAAVLTHASDSDPDNPIGAELAELPLKARQALKRVVSSSLRSGWEIKGTVRQRRYGAETVQLTPQGAVRLRTELDAQAEERRAETQQGTIDGFRRSLGTLYFAPSSGGKIIQAAVVDNVIAAKVTEYFSDPDSVVEATFDVFERHLPGDELQTRISRVLRDIRKLDIGRQLTFDGE